MPVAPPEKVCTECELPKPREEFWADAGKPDGRMTACKACTTARRERNAALKQAGAPVDSAGRVLLPEERERRSQQAVERHQAGELGRSEYARAGGLAARETASRRLLAHFAEAQNFELVLGAVTDNLRSGRNSDKLAAARMITDLEASDRVMRIKERGGGPDPHSMTDEELDALAHQLLEAKLRAAPADITLPESSVRETLP